MLRALVLLFVAAGMGVVLHKQLRSRRAKQVVVITPEQLSKFDGSNGGKLYLSIMGEVYDVTPGSRHYSKGNGYHHFVGRDATRAFISGEFEKDLTDNVTDYGVDECGGIVHWRGFFRNHTEYRLKALLAGAFYDAKGHPLPELKRVEELAAQAKSAEERMREIEAKFARCNSRWNQASGGFVWCDDGMYPRKIISTVPGGKSTSRCACFKELGWSDIRQIYENCDPQATECQITPPGPSPGLLSRGPQDMPKPTEATADATPEEVPTETEPAGTGHEEL